MPSNDLIRWETTDRGFRHYAPVDGHEVYESSAAESPHLWVDGEHLTVEEATALRDEQPFGRWRGTLTAAIDGHYQTRTNDPEAWAAGDPCALCGSTNTALTDGIAVCNDCGASE